MNGKSNQHAYFMTGRLIYTKKGEKMLNNTILEKNNIELIGKDETFSQIPKWSKYFISNYGRLLHKNKKNRYTIVNPSITKGGYLTYTLSKPARTYKGQKLRKPDGTAKTQKDCRTAQELVAIMYVKNPYPKAEYTIEDVQVHHKDRNRTNNYYKNLMWLCKTKNGRKDHDFIHSIRKIALYNEDTTIYHTYKDIDVLLNHLDIDVLELIDTLKYSDTKIKDGKWTTYKVNDCYVGVQFSDK